MCPGERFLLSKSEAIHWAAPIVEACAAFAFTNIDDLVLLFAWNAQRLSFRRILCGQIVGIGALVGVSLLGSLGITRLPSSWVRLLGIVPLMLGLSKLQSRWRYGDAAVPAAGSADSALSIAALTVAGGGDNVAAYVPLFSANPGAIGIDLVVFTLMTVIWCGGARTLAQQRMMRRLLDRAGPWLTPVVFVVLGIGILTGSQ